MEKVIGNVRFDVYVNCPNCNGRLDLTRWPYDEDKFGRTFFGSVGTPGKWSDINIKYRCEHCKKEFILKGIEY